MKLFKRLKNRNGLTLIELLISVTISLIVVVAAGFILLTQSGAIRLNRSVSSEQQKLNVAFHTVKYYLRMAGFDYGTEYFIQPGAIPPVQYVNANYPSNPYEALITYSGLSNNGPCYLTAVANGNSASSEFDLGPNCNYQDFHKGQIISLYNVIPLNNNALPSLPVIFCITNVQSPPTGTYGRVQFSPGQNSCNNNPTNLIPSKSVYGGDISSVSQINQVLFYWGNQSYSFNAPYNIPGHLYECEVSSPVYEPTLSGFTDTGISTYNAPVCDDTKIISLSDYIYSFSITPNTGLMQNGQSYSWNLAILGESDVGVTTLPSYGAHDWYNPNNNGGGNNGTNCYDSSNGAKENCIPNISEIIKTMNSNVFVRNVYYGR